MVERQARPAFLEVDLASEEGKALCDSVAEKFGPAIANAAAITSRMFLLRSPWAPGLRFVGAETRPYTSDAGDAPPFVFSLSGSGETIEDAFVSCVGEGVDRLALIERRGDVTEIAPLRKIAHRVPPSALAAIEQDVVGQTVAGDTPLAWVGGKALGPDAEFANGFDVLLPADWCLRRAPGVQRLKPRTALSVGVAAGPDFNWAASRALLELIERDAASLWWTGGRRGKNLPLEAPGMAGIAELVAALRQQSGRRVTWLLDITTDIGIPVVAALSCDADGRQLAYGLAARLTIEAAARAAIFELCQTELALLFAHIKREEAGEAKLSQADRAHLDRAVKIDAGRCDLLHPLGAAPSRHVTAAGTDLATIAGATTRAAIEVALIDHARAEYGIPVVRAVAPALQPMPSDIATARLRRTIGDCGGGARYTGDIALIV